MNQPHQFLEILKTKTLYDLWRLSHVLTHMLQDPRRLQDLKKQLVVGQEVVFFDVHLNREVPLKINQVDRTMVQGVRLDTHDSVSVPLIMLNLSGIDPFPTMQQASLNRHTVKVGDTVAFINKQREEVFGTVLKLNPKTVRLKTAHGFWKVDYSLLMPVIDGACAPEQDSLMMLKNITPE